MMKSLYPPFFTTILQLFYIIVRRLSRALKEAVRGCIKSVKGEQNENKIFFIIPHNAGIQYSKKKSLKAKNTLYISNYAIHINVQY